MPLEAVKFRMKLRGFKRSDSLNVLKYEWYRLVFAIKDS